jgi:hypothetical protein
MLHERTHDNVVGNLRLLVPRELTAYENPNSKTVVSLEQESDEDMVRGAIDIL